MDYRNGPTKGTAGIRGKDDDRKLFVGALPKPCEEKDIREAFSPYGTIESININTDPTTKQSRGFCFIVFSDANVIEKILKDANIEIHGKKVDPRRVIKSSGKVFIGGLTSEFNEDVIRDYFGKKGNITEIQWPFDKQKNQRKAYCFLTFENRETVTELLKTPKLTVLGKELDIKKVKFNPETMWQYGGPAGAYPPRGPRGGYPPSYGYQPYAYDYAGAEYGEYDGSSNYADPYYDPYAYDRYPSEYPVNYAPPRAQRGRTQRHNPY